MLRVFCLFEHGKHELDLKLPYVCIIWIGYVCRICLYFCMPIGYARQDHTSDPFHSIKPWVYSYQKRCRGWNADLGGWLSEENLSSAK